MSVLGDKYMWIMVLFDLPVNNKEARKKYSRFRNFLLGDGYFMLQYSIYVRICRGVDAVEKHINRMKNKLPSEGSIRILTITDMQYKKMLHIIGPIKKQEKTLDKQLILL